MLVTLLNRRNSCQYLSSSLLLVQLWIYTVPAGVATVVVAVAFWWSKPPLPPTATSDDNPSPPFFRGLWMVRMELVLSSSPLQTHTHTHTHTHKHHLQTITNGSFWILMLVWGGGAGLFNALLTLLPQFVCPFGYSDVSLMTVPQHFEWQ